MRLKVITKHYVITSPETVETAQIVHYDDTQDFFFIYENNLLKLEGSPWQKQISSLEDCFKAIKQYFHGSHYKIVDVINMNM